MTLQRVKDKVIDISDGVKDTFSKGVDVTIDKYVETRDFVNEKTEHYDNKFKQNQTGIHNVFKKVNEIAEDNKKEKVDTVKVERNLQTPIKKQANFIIPQRPVVQQPNIQPQFSTKPKYKPDVGYQKAQKSVDELFGMNVASGREFRQYFGEPIKKRKK